MSPAPTYRALKNANYRLYFFGQLVSMTGTWMQGVVVSWLVYRLTDSAHWVGLVSFANSVPAFALSPFAGIVADRYDRRKILIIVEILQMSQALALAALVYSGSVQAWHIAALSAFLGATSAFDITTRHAFAADLVPKEEISSAISLNALAINSSRVVGPSLGGLVLQLAGEAAAFLGNAVSYVAVLYGLLKMKSVAIPRHHISESVGRQLGQAVRYLLSSRPECGKIRRYLGLATFISFVAFPYVVVLPVISKEVLHGDGQTLAWMTSAAGVGAVFGILTLGFRSSAHIERSVYVDFLLTGLGLIALGLSRNLMLSLLASFVIGHFLMSVFPKMNASIQSLVEDSLRARVLSVYTMTFLGAVPLGSLLAGSLTDVYGPGPVAVGCGVLAGAAGGTLLLWSRLRCFWRPDTIKMET